MLSAYLAPAVFAARRKLVTLFQPLVSADDIDLAIAELTKCGAVEPLRSGSAQIIVYLARR
jgi:hypothetical protein